MRITLEMPLIAMQAKEAVARLEAAAGAEASGSEGEGEEVHFRAFEERQRGAWDCESIQSTRSTLYNHPATIDAQPSRSPSDCLQVCNMKPSLHTLNLDKGGSAPTLDSCFCT